MYNFAELEFVQYPMNYYNSQMWQQFFKKNNPLIDRRIIKTLLRAQYAYDPDIVANIRADIIERFIKKGLLNEYKRNENFDAWLGVVVKNYTKAKEGSTNGR